MLKRLEKLMKRMSFSKTWMSFLVVEASFLLLALGSVRLRNMAQVTRQDTQP